MVRVGAGRLRAAGESFAEGPTKRPDRPLLAVRGPVRRRRRRTTVEGHSARARDVRRRRARAARLGHRGRWRAGGDGDRGRDGRASGARHGRSATRPASRPWCSPTVAAPLAWTDNSRSSRRRRTRAACTSRSTGRHRRRPRRPRSASARRAIARCGPGRRSCCRFAAAPPATCGELRREPDLRRRGLTLDRAGTALLRFRPARPGRTATPGPVRIGVRWSAPGRARCGRVTLSRAAAAAARAAAAADRRRACAPAGRWQAGGALARGRPVDRRPLERDRDPGRRSRSARRTS